MLNKELLRSHLKCIQSFSSIEGKPLSTVIIEPGFPFYLYVEKVGCYWLGLMLYISDSCKGPQKETNICMYGNKSLTLFTVILSILFDTVTKLVILYYAYEHFACMHVHHVGTMPMEARGQQ